MNSAHMVTVSNDFAFPATNFLRISSLDIFILCPSVPCSKDDTVVALSYKTLLS